MQTRIHLTPPERNRMKNKDKNKKPLHNLDLNLLKIFRVVSEEKKTVAAAKRLNITQPAVSRAMARLREHFNDPLFVRTRYGLKPTDKGQLLSDSLPKIMDDLSNLILELDEFSPESSSANIKIAINGFFGVSFPAKLHLKLLDIAPNITIETESWSSNTISKLINGELDLGINYPLNNVPKELQTKHLATDEFQILARDAHPLSDQAIDCNDLSLYPIVTAIVPDWNENRTLIESWAERENIETETAFRSSSILSLLEVISETDALFPTSAFLSRKHLSGLKSLSLSPQLKASFKGESQDIYLYMHYRHRNSPIYKWLIPIIESTLSSINDN
ncbi:TPA: LysR family transcriptional regulator [Vibrio parahaemolyticus]|uniref:LysR family transcriptional regulator n=1 Tax=Vibrio TaxID=662 RepID=UPI000410996F|nr:LysR family transcriptional regulator [Vibrio parahaemolyticus]EJA7354636.1 LysR family transcriptional regulator [Vibrio parahaemolyticus]EKH9200402.1 LysR family transcriptional regulator [Vibrio parahaemolyticus]MBM4997392.1 LysR family transcriptional regulator [Vibrio parahaemolyticus]TBT47779.1 LysR family transcriptional regulator [Vibrio parahaemolyticus]HBC3884593.1 LysR family transcriptional regulator [Vibrio parahaemolyticus]